MAEVKIDLLSQLVKSEAFRDYVRDLYKVYFENSHEKEWIDKRPTIHSWILTIEKLPEEGRFVLLCFKNGKTCPHFRYQVGYLGMHDIEDNNFVKTGEKQVWYTNNFYYDFDEVIAWMPIPDYGE